MNSVIWGPLFWKTFDMIAVSHDQRSSTRAIQMIRNFQYLLPCRYCRESMQRFVADANHDSTNPLRFVYDLHTRVNGKLEKTVPAAFSFAVYETRQKLLGTQLSLYDVNNLITILAANYDHNPEPAQETAWRYFWQMLPDYIQDPNLRAALRAVRLPTNRPLSSRVLRQVLRLSNTTWKKVESMRNWKDQ